MVAKQKIAALIGGAGFFAIGIYGAASSYSIDIIGASFVLCAACFIWFFFALNRATPPKKELKAPEPNPVPTPQAPASEQPVEQEEWNPRPRIPETSKQQQTFEEKLGSILDGCLDQAKSTATLTLNIPMTRKIRYRGEEIEIQGDIAIALNQPVANPQPQPEQPKPQATTPKPEPPQITEQPCTEE